MDYERQLDKVKAKVFLDKSSGFFGSIMCSLAYEFVSTIKTAAVNRTKMLINPEWFFALPIETQFTVFMHELRHIAYLHELRGKTKQHDLWNKACDFRINNDLKKEGFTFTGIDIDSICLDESLDIPKIKSEEEIYNLLLNGANIQIPKNYEQDIVEEPKETNTTTLADMVNIISNAYVQEKILSGAGNLPSDLEEIINDFMYPKESWDIILQRFFQDISEEYSYSYDRQNKRYRSSKYDDIRIPRIKEEDGRLEHLAYFLDTSGSMTRQELVAFNGIIQYVFNTLQPQRMTIIMFDTKIKKEFDLVTGDELNSLSVFGRGGTSFEPVKEWLDENKPNGAVIYSDMDCKPMKKLKQPIPLIWAATTGYGRNIKVPSGEIIEVTVS